MGYCLNAIVFCCAIFPYISLLQSNTREWEFIVNLGDDENYIDSEAVRSLSWAALRTIWIPTGPDSPSIFEPMALTVKAVVFALFGFDSWSIRILSLVCHGLCSSLLFSATALMFKRFTVYTAAAPEKNSLPTSPPSCDSSSVAQRDLLVQQFSISHMRIQSVEVRENLCALVSSVLYAVHPIHAEVVGLPSSCSFALGSVFCLLALVAGLRTVDARLVSGLYLCATLCHASFLHAAPSFALLGLLYTSARGRLGRYATALVLILSTLLVAVMVASAAASALLAPAVAPPFFRCVCCQSVS